jgi:hypothetical protein
MSLRGSVRTMPVGDLFDWIDRRFACGTLTLERGAVRRSFHFDSGYVTNASSGDPSEYLGQLLRTRSLVDEAALDDAFRVQADTGVMLGKILLMTGAIDEDTLRGILELKIHEALCDAMALADGTFEFEPEVEPATVSELEVSVNLRSAIDAGAERTDAWREIRRLIPTEQAVFFVVDRAAAADEHASLLDGIEAGRTAEQLVLEQPRTRFEVMTALVRLLSDESIAVDRREMARDEQAAMSADELERAARGRAAGGDRAGALELVLAALESDPENERVLQLRREMERSVFAELSRSLLTSFRVPKLLKSKQELESLEMNNAERYLTGRIDGRWDLLSLLRISPMREIEALMAFKRLADRGIISL